MDDEEEIVEESEEESNEEEKTDKVELDFSMDPIERLEKETALNKSGLAVALGKYLLEQLKRDSALKNAYFNRKITLDAVEKFVNDCAKKELNSKNGAIEDIVVYGWVLHYVQDEPVEIKTAEKLVLSVEDKEAAKKKALEQYQAEELARIKKAEAKAKEREEKKAEKALKKEKEEFEASGQMNLFDFLEG